MRAMGKREDTSRTDRWVTIVTVAVFVMAAVGAGFAIHTLLPPLLNEPDLKYSMLRYAAILVVAFFVVALAARFRRG